MKTNVIYRKRRTVRRRIKGIIARSGVKKWLKMLLLIYSLHQEAPRFGAKYVAVITKVIVISAKAIIFKRKRTLGNLFSFLVSLYIAHPKQTRPIKTLLKPVKVIKIGSVDNLG